MATAFTPMDGHALHLNTCSACGALVADPSMELHTVWHLTTAAPEMQTRGPAGVDDVPAPLTLAQLKERQRRAENTKPEGVRLGTRTCGTPCYTYTGVLMGSCALPLGHGGAHSVHAAELAMVPDGEVARRRGKR